MDRPISRSSTQPEASEASEGSSSTGLARRLSAEFVGTAMLLAAIVGSGITGTRLTADSGLTLLINALATAAVLAALITAVGPVSGAHLNPAVTLVDRTFRGMGTVAAATYIAAQIAGGIVGVVLANIMFDLPVIELSGKGRADVGVFVGEALATFGLVLVVFGTVRVGRAMLVPTAVGAYIGAAVLFTSSTAFANPAVTIARIFTETFAGIHAGSVPAFLLAQLVGAGVGAACVWLLYPDAEDVAPQVLVPHDGDRRV